MACKQDFDTIRLNGIAAMAGFTTALNLLNSTVGQLSDSCFDLLKLNNAADTMVKTTEMQLTIDRIISGLSEWLVSGQDPTTRVHFTTVFEALEDLQKIVMRFRLIATFAAIDVSVDETAKINEFVADLRAVPEKISQSLAQVSQSVRAVQVSHRRANSAVDGSLAALMQIKDDFQAKSTPLRQILGENIDALAKTRRFGEEFQTEAQKHANGFIRAFQFSDALAQRLDHISMILTEPVSPPAQILAQALTTALLADGHGILNDIRLATSDMAALTKRFDQAFSNQSDSTAESLAAQRLMLAQILQARDQINATIRLASDGSSSIFDEIQLALTKFAELMKLSAIIDLAAVNTRIRSGRLATARDSMAVLSSAVMDSAKSCRVTLAGCQDAMAQISKTQDPSLVADLTNNVLNLLNLLDSCQDGLLRSEQGADTLAAARASVANCIQDLHGTLGQCSFASQNMERVLTKLDRLNHGLPEGAVNPEDVEAFYSLYTMESERIVHDALVGRPQTAATSTATDLADVFF